MKLLKAQTIVPEIIVVDGFSSDETRDIAGKYADKVVFDNKEGLGDARNVGWQNASADIIAYCDADCRPDKDWCEKILKEFSEDKELSAISGPLIAYDGSLPLKFSMNIWAAAFPGRGCLLLPRLWGNRSGRRFGWLRCAPRGTL